jgi:hypothetical protein
MSLAPSERRALARIEHTLRNNDPKLAALMAIFTVLTSRRYRIPHWTWLSPWRPRLRYIIPAAIAVAVIFLTTALTAP